ncbi:Fpg/Nei family DNA glycosylase [Agromyces sp. SYSU K20354]|uniref:DNA-formamidopyrimidine glycosylase family protein n=1 Tax=Agromyces cavernae TaxID=2898659 RepID=UPI001E59F41F|nr:DNA-formamidopyrimidine glycosylase family protein [Agromyces cavernae]MCD2443733.1 Fpg/Nei family DNA glycosylase [Agromyces cavernae]
MPEGDTVFRVARELDAALAGRVVTRTDFRVPAIATVDLAGERFHSVASRGKHLLMRIGDRVVHSHLKMEGEWRLFAAGERWRRPEWQARAIIEVPGVTAVGFDLGQLDEFPADEERARLDHLGPDLLGPDWDADEAVRRITTTPDVSIAVALGDQRNLAGLGNVYVNELCFLRGILPTRPVAELELEPLVRLAARVIRANRDRAVRTTTGDLHRGRQLWVYRRGGEPCRRCGTSIEHARLGRNDVEQRETWWCPNCQA